METSESSSSSLCAYRLPIGMIQNGHLADHCDETFKNPTDAVLKRGREAEGRIHKSLFIMSLLAKFPDRQELKWPIST